MSREIEEYSELCSTYIGTLDYMSPEIKSSISYDYKTDIW